MSRVRATSRTKLMPCRFCGKDMVVGMNTRKPPNHIECGLNEATQNMLELRNKSGPRYERWRNAIIALGDSQSRGGGSPRQ